MARKINDHIENDHPPDHQMSRDRMSNDRIVSDRIVSDRVQGELRKLPSVDELCRGYTSMEQAEPAPARSLLVRAARALVAERRQAILAGKQVTTTISNRELHRRARREGRSTLREVLNATGIVIHTNLGRAPLAERAIERITALARGYSSLEYDLDQGERGSRHVHASGLLCELSGAEDAVVVNNNAAAVMLCLAAHAAGRSVVVSRGELIEIGGSFRIPDVMRLSGAELVEVGTTNRTHLADYAAGIDERCAMLLKVHPSNYAIVGFTHEVGARELTELGRERGVMTVFDLGSGALIELPVFRQHAKEQTVRQAVEAGFDLVTFSGDKLVGGPQAGIIVGKRAAIAKVRKHPLMRALRPDKLCFAALEATLELYRDDRVAEELPVIRALSASNATLSARAEALARLLEPLPAGFRVKTAEVTSRAGGGSYPIADLKSWAVTLGHVSLSAQKLQAQLRDRDLPVIGRIADALLVLDLLMIEELQLQRLATAILETFGAPRDG